MPATPAKRPTPDNVRKLSVGSLTSSAFSQPIADPDTIAELSRSLSDDALHCRVNRRHDWRSSTVKREKFGFRVVEACRDCGSSRWQEIDRRGLVVRSGVNYAEGYLNPKGTGRVDQAAGGEYRLEMLGRMLHTDLHKAARRG